LFETVYIALQYMFSKRTLSIAPGDDNALSRDLSPTAELPILDLSINL